MKKLFVTIAIASCAIAAYATINGNGYYRVKNYGSARWASLVDNTGSIDFVAGTADLHALQLSNNTEATLSDPGSIVYLTNVSGYQYDVASQGTSLAALVQNPVYIGPNGTAPDGQTLYRIWGTYKNVTKYIMDTNFFNDEEYGTPSISGINAPAYYNWYVYPVDVKSDNYFGAIPSVKVGNNQYCTLFTSFAYKPYSQGVKAYYIGRVGFGMAEMIEITGAVPPASPVIIQCAGPSVADNKLELVTSPEVLPSNALSGVYFDYNENRVQNQVIYNPNTMRVLGVTSDGSLGFITVSNLSSIPANTAYLTVPANSSFELKCVSTAEFEANLPNAPEDWYVEEGVQLYPQDDYTYSGTFELPATSSKYFNFYLNSTRGEQLTIGPSFFYGGDYLLNLMNESTTAFSYNSPYSWVLNNWTGGEITITLNLQYQYVTFSGKETAVESISAADSSIKYINNVVYADGASEIVVYNMAGQAVAKSSNGSLDVTALPKGIYIAKTAGESIKITR